MLNININHNAIVRWKICAWNRLKRGGGSRNQCITKIACKATIVCSTL